LIWITTNIFVICKVVVAIEILERAAYFLGKRGKKEIYYENLSKNTYYS
jgi:hypothetical protein